MLTKIARSRANSAGRWGRPLGANPACLLRHAAVFTSIFFGSTFASGFFGSVTVSTPLANSAPIFSASTLSGSAKLRWNEP